MQAVAAHRLIEKFLDRLSDLFRSSAVMVVAPRITVIKCTS